MSSKIRLAVLFGGKSTEHEGSIESALHILSYLNLEKFSIHAVWVRQDGSFSKGREILELLESWLDSPHISPFPQTKIPPSDFFQRMNLFALALEPEYQGEEDFFENARKGLYDAAFPVFHGLNGEDGTVQGFLEFLRIPYVGPGVLGSALAMDKDLSKRVCRAAGLETTPWLAYSLMNWKENPAKCLSQVEESFSYPVFVKPSRLGSSMGISKAKNRKELEQGLTQAFLFDQKVMVEQMVFGHEYALGVMGNDRLEVSVPAQFMSNGPDFFDYNAKFGPGGLEDLIPAPLAPEMIQRLQDFSLRVYRSLELSGMARVDSFIQNGEILFNEVNTIPGFGGHSVFNRLWEQDGLSKSQVVEKLVALALEKEQSRNTLQYRFL